MSSVLIVDDQKELHDILKVVVQPLGCDAEFAFDGQEALDLFKNNTFDVVLSDISMSPMDGITLLNEIKGIDSNAIVILMTGYGSMDTAVSALKSGAFDYIQKPLKIKEFVAALKKGLDAKNRGMISRPIAQISQRTIPPFQASENCYALIGKNKQIVKAQQQVDRLIKVSTPVLIQGEVGTGKKMVALTIHHSSSFNEGELVAVDCSLADQITLREQIIGSDGMGGPLIERATGGSLYLQSIQSMDLELQAAFAKLLKAVGHQFRLICSSEEDLEAKMDLEEFSHDLFYRIALSVIQLPSLTARLDDLEDVVRTIMDNSSNFKFDSRKIELSDDAFNYLREQKWSRNLEQLVQRVTNAVANTEDRVITPEMLQS
ncbi:MAG: response regulator [Verrucomicrobiae bacterium]|nr:response regulator [Verrucomicrobiae bacterium]